MIPRRDHETGLYGFWSGSAWVVEPCFGYAHNFNKGYAAVKLSDNSYGLVGKNGEVRDISAICGGRTPVWDGFSFSGFVDFQSESSLYAPIRTLNHGQLEWGLIDTSLAYRPLPGDEFYGVSSIISCGDFVILIREDTTFGSVCGLFNLVQMRLELPVEYSHIYTSRESMWAVSQKRRDSRAQGATAFYDVERHAFMSPWFWEALPFSEGLGARRDREDARWCFVDGHLRPSFESEFDGVRRFSHGLAAVYEGDDAGYIDTTGRMRLVLPYDDLQPFNEYGWAVVSRDDEEWAIIDRAGQPHLAGLDVADYWSGDFPYFQVTKNGSESMLDMSLGVIYSHSP